MGGYFGLSCFIDVAKEQALTNFSLYYLQLSSFCHNFLFKIIEYQQLMFFIISVVIEIQKKVMIFVRAIGDTVIILIRTP